VSKPDDRNEGARAQGPPSIAIPKGARGGGAISGMGEKFSANPVTGTGSMSVPIATSPGRSGFGPQLSLAYDSGSGNGPFGFGWSLSLPSIARKTDKALPRYVDEEESDVFILSGAEDLVPVLDSNGAGHRDEAAAPGYVIHRYRPRIEGLFARIERWTRVADGDVHWRSLSRDNILTIYGFDSGSRIADVDDPLRVFSWLICETRDDRGNAILYRYKAEDGTLCDLARSCERNRGARADPARTANRYLKHVLYGNRVPLLDANGRRPRFLDDLPASTVADPGWMFDLVLDYGEHDADSPTPGDAGPWAYRDDPFSSYRSGFEVRTTRLCRRALMFHDIPDTGDGRKGYVGLVRSTDFTYSTEPHPAAADGPVYSFLKSAAQAGYRPQVSGGYRKAGLPPIEFDYSEPVVQERVERVDPLSLENLPAGVHGPAYRWTDLYGEGLQGVLTEQAGSFFYKRNLSPIGGGSALFSASLQVAEKPLMTLAGGAQLLDLAGDGRPDLVMFDGPAPGFYRQDEKARWQNFRPFESGLERDMADPNLRFVDLNGDGRADVLITEEDALVWHPSLGEAGFAAASRVACAPDEEKGPRLVFASDSESVHLADMSGDGLSDLVRIRNGEICYWPNLGYGRFGAKVAMDRAPHFDNPDQFDHARLRLGDIDGTGTTDLVYLHRDGVVLYFNQSGNGWSRGRRLDIVPRVEELASIELADILGNGTICLVWSSPLPGDAWRPMRYVNLIGPLKPHLMVGTRNNLGAETIVRYAPSTFFYLQDERDGRPWLTSLPFPVHVVERVETVDHIARNRFVARYAYHHGHFDAEEREFRGFGMVEQWDTEALAALTAGDALAAANENPASDLAPVLTRTWYHTGLYLDREHVSNFFAGLLGDRHEAEYYRPPGMSDLAFRDQLLPDTILPLGLTVDEEREACRALKGSMLRQEVYARDGGPLQDHPYSVVEQNFAVRIEQERGTGRHAVFFSHPRETVTWHYERNPADPRIQHAMTLEVDAFGNVLKEAAIGYGRTQSDLAEPADQARQTVPLATLSEHRFSAAIGAVTSADDDYRAPLPCETRSWEVTGHARTGPAGRFRAADFTPSDASEIPYEATAGAGPHRRLIEHVRTLYRGDDLDGLAPLGISGRLALPGETYRLAFTPGLIDQAFVREGVALLPAPTSVLEGGGADRGGYVSSQTLKGDGRFPLSDPGDGWWIPSGRVFLSPGAGDSAAQELAHARNHFFLPWRWRDPFHDGAESTESLVVYDGYDLLPLESRDPAGNRITAGGRKPDGSIDPAVGGNDYRVLQPALVTDPNRNRTAIAYDALGLPVATAMMGKAEEALGDTLAGLAEDVAEADVVAHFADPLADPAALLGGATLRMVYDLDAYARTRHLPQPQPPGVCTLAREVHVSELGPGEAAPIQQSFSYSDGFGREIQKKIRAEPGPLADGGPEVDPRWVGSGWTIFNNKGKPVRRFEPFFSATGAFEFGIVAGVSPILFYDPIGRVVATLHPDHSYEKILFDPWRQSSFDRNDTVLGDPRGDPDVAGLMAGHFAALGPDGVHPAWRTWHEQRQSGALGVEAQAAAAKAAAHAGTEALACLDALGRVFLTIADNGDALFATRTALDIEGNPREVRDALDRIVMAWSYDMLGNRIRQSSMEAGERWTLADAAGKPLRAWDSRGHDFATDHDVLRRPLRTRIGGAAPASLTGRIVYGEQHPDAEARNLRGKAWLHLDQAGSVTADAHDFKGNPVRASRRLTAGNLYRGTVDWTAADAAIPSPALDPVDEPTLGAALSLLLEADAYTSLTHHDALNRPVALTTPHSPAMAPSIVRPRYNEANLLERVDVNLRGELDGGGAPAWTPFVLDIDYDAKGQRVRIEYGNKVVTTYEHDPLTYRLTRLVTRRDPADFPGDCPQSPAPGWPGCQVQDLRYAYDAVGNVTHIDDRAQQAIFFAGRRVDPSADYEYDPIYRLVRATGREHLGQSGAPQPHSHADSGRRNLPHPGDGTAMGAYVESYEYDSVGNMLRMRHRGANPVHPGWTRDFSYLETSQIEPGKRSNRLSGTSVGGGLTEPYAHDAHGNMIAMPHLAGMAWDERDRLAHVDLGGGGDAFYVYDAAGQRVRKVWEKSANLLEERIYLAGLEIFRRRQGADLLERETLHIMDDEQRIASVETRTVDTAEAEFALPQRVRYLFGNQLGSVGLELDDAALILSYEEYSPYGSTTYQAGQGLLEARKRYRFAGKERDEESGLAYHRARYYAPWTASWTSCDPLGIKAGLNLYSFVSRNPITRIDPEGTDDFHIFASSLKKKNSLQVKQTEDATNTYYYHAADGAVTKLATLDVIKNKTLKHDKLSATKDMINMKGFKSSFLGTNYVQSGNTFLEENVLAAVLGTAYEIHQEIGKKIFLNQLNAAEGGHSKHGSMGDRVDIQYIRTDNKSGQNYADWPSFDKESNQKLVDRLKEYGFTRAYTQAAKDVKEPALLNTKYSKDHYHHLHVDAGGKTITPGTYSSTETGQNPDSQKFDKTEKTKPLVGSDQYQSVLKQGPDPRFSDRFRDSKAPIVRDIGALIRLFGF
jgi:RHS repeat-associated protein